nr:hypothetical protein [Tanacetum cinerariifolium]
VPPEPDANGLDEPIDIWFCLPLMMIVVRQTKDCDMLLHMVTTDMKLLVVEIEIDDMTADDVDKVSWSTDVEKSKQVDLKFAHASIELHLHDIHVV